MSIEMVIEVRIDGKIERRNLMDDLVVDEEHINDYLIKSPGITAYWQFLYEKQRTIVQKLKSQLDRKNAELDKYFRENAGKITDKAVAAKITSDVEYSQMEDVLLENQETLNVLRAAVESVKEFRSILISLSANLRTQGLPTRFGRKGESVEYLSTSSSPLSDKLREIHKQKK